MPAAEWTIKRERSNPSHPYMARLRAVDDLRRWLAQLGLEKASNFFLTNEETGDELTVLMDSPFAAVCWMRASDRLSFSASTDPSFEAALEADCHVFHMGATPTPVPKDRCLDFSTMKRVVEHVFIRGTLPRWIAWRQ